MEEECGCAKNKSDGQWEFTRWVVRRLLAVVIVLIVVMVGMISVGGALIYQMQKEYQSSVEMVTQMHLDYLSQYDFSGTTEVIVDGQDGGNANYHAGGGDIINGDRKSKDD